MILAMFSSAEKRLCGRLGYRFARPELLETALRHRSWCAENGFPESNERLEFLGDSVLGLVTTEYLFALFPDEPEGALARRRASLVNAVALSVAADELGVGAALRLGRGEETTGGRRKPSILADAMEAVIGAVHVDGGGAASGPLVRRLLDGPLRPVEQLAGGDAKSRFQELLAKARLPEPVYDLEECGPAHERRYHARVLVANEEWGSGSGTSKKEAEQRAAEQALARPVPETVGRRTRGEIVGS